jgi:hypothetical protein
MRRAFLTVVVTVFAVLSVAAPANQAMACWCNRVYTSYYYDPCVSCPAPTVTTCAAPACVSTCAAPACLTPTSCYTSSEQRCYLEPQVSYRIVTRLEPQTFYVRRAYYDPFSCCSRSYYYPATQYVERSYQVPVTSYVQRCYLEPQTVCPTPTSPAPTPANGETTGVNSRAATSQPSARKGSGLDRPVYREPVPKSNSPPKPVPMPAPQSSRPRSLTVSHSQASNPAGTRLSATAPQRGSAPGNRIVQWP